MPRERVPKGAPTFRHSYDAVRFRSFTANVYVAIELLETYRRDYRGLVSSRLHCYLPVRSLGVPVDFQPKNRSDPRFAGLIDITDAEFDRMQSTINDKLAAVMTAILAGTEADEVYALWAELNADEVAAAQRRRAETHPMPRPASTCGRSWPPSPLRPAAGRWTRSASTSRCWCPTAARPGCPYCSGRCWPTRRVR